MKNYGDLWVTERLEGGMHKVLSGSGETLGSIIPGMDWRPLWQQTWTGHLSPENLRDILSIMRAIENGDQ